VKEENGDLDLPRLSSGPAINILAIVLTGAVLGPEMGIARGVGAVVFAILIGLAMHFISG
jgi:hypothetical protein